MPQWRKLWTKTTESLDINDMPDDFHRLLWIMLPLITCREGRGLDNAAWIKAKAMPLRMDVSPAQVGKAMDWYARRGMIQRYEVDNRGYFAIRNWDKYQGNTTRESPSDYPAPSSCEDDASLQEQVTTNSRPTQELLTTNSGTDADADADADAEEMHEHRALYLELLDRWAVLFPEKSQPKPTNNSNLEKLQTRLKDSDFRETWDAALLRASRSQYLHGEGWFTVEWFLKNDSNWRKCLDGNYESKGNGHKPEGAGIGRRSDGWAIPG
jgi:hypothetical protein